MTYYYLKTLHHLFVLVWIFGLIYTASLFVLREKFGVSNNTDNANLTLKFWRYATWPSMIIGMITGMAMLHLRLFHLADLWMQVKLVGVIFLVGFHIKCHLLFIGAVRTNETSKPKSAKSWAQGVAMGATLGVFFLFLMGLKDSFQWVSGTVIATSVTALIGFWLAKKT